MSTWKSPAVPIAAASLGLATLATLYASTSAWSSKATPVATAVSEEVKDDKEQKDKEKEAKDKRYETRFEHYSPNTGNWEVRENNVDEDAEKGLLFTAKHRSWPKSADWAGHEDYCCITVHSAPLIDVLRLELKEVEEAFEDKPNLNAQDLFLHLKALHALVEERKKVSEELKLEEEKTAKEAESKAESEKEKEKDVAEGEKVLEESKSTTSDEPAKIEASEIVKTEDPKPSEEATTVDEKLEKAIEAPSTSTEVDKLAESKVNGDKKEDSSNELDEDLYTAKKKQNSEGVAIEAEHLAVLLGFIDELFAPIKSKLDRFLVDNVISFQLLWAIYPTGCIVEMQDDVSGEYLAFTLKTCNYALTRDGLVFQINGQRLVWNGTRFVKNWINAQLSKFKGMRKISSLSAHPLTDKRKAELTARGRLYVGLARVAFVSYSGNLIQVIGGGLDRRIIKLRAEGRAVVDTKSYRRMNPSRSNYIWEDEDEDDMGDYVRSDSASATVSEEELCLLPPTVFGFSLVQRQWGEMRVDQFSEVVFNPEAYNKLVLDEDQKELVRCLVQQNSDASKARALELDSDNPPPEVMHDFIQGKSGGLVIVLHGRPGTGKTLTAEAVSEMLKVPLYAIGAGELGVTASVLEDNLKDILSVAAQWGAVMLIDEADVFIEARSMYDVARNSMVSVFLRLLEYHSGILILTTNRIRTIDPAFLSRFSIALTYPDLDVPKRRAIWCSFIELAGARVGPPANRKKLTNGDIKAEDEDDKNDKRPIISSKYVDQLAKKPFNGRTAKNIMRTSSSLALGKNEPLNEDHISVVVKVTEDFMADFNEPDESAPYDAPGEGWRDKSTSYM